jgi:hypothetical protein
MAMKKMRIRITNDGRTEIAVEGGEGGDCLEFTRAMERALGQVEQRELTEDYEKESVQVFEQEMEGGGL